MECAHLCIITTKQRIQFVSFLSLPCRILWGIDLCFCTRARGTLHTAYHIVHTHTVLSRFMKIFRCAYLMMEAVHRHPRHQMPLIWLMISLNISWIKSLKNNLTVPMTDQIESLKSDFEKLLPQGKYSWLENWGCIFEFRMKNVSRSTI